jgi:signal peptidase I
MERVDPSPTSPAGASADNADATAETDVVTATAENDVVTATTVETGRKRKKPRSPTKQIIEWLILIGSALLIALLIKAFLFQAFYIPSESMVPTLKKNDRVLVNKLSYRLHDVHRSDIVVFEAPPGQEDQVKDLVKRVIGLPGDTVEGREGHVYVNGEPLEEDYLPDGTVTEPFDAQKVPPDHYWVMGDNRSRSRDSRWFGFIPEDDIVGRVFLRIWPPTRLDFM